MRLVFVHADYLAFEATTAADEELAETEDAPAEGRTEDCVVAFVTVEGEDRADLGAVVANAAEAVRDATDRLNAREVVLYPSAHLSDDPADSETAATALRDLAAALDGEYEVLRAPVGWHTAFEVRDKGHPFSAFSRRVTAERPAERDPSEWRLVFPGGEVGDLPGAADDDRVSDEVRALVEAEMGAEQRTAQRTEQRTAQRTEQRTETEDDAPSATEASRRSPRETLVRDALAAYARDLAVEYGATPVETPGDADPFGNDGLALAGVADARERGGRVRLYETDAAGGFGTIRAATRDADEAREEFRAQARLAVRAGEDLGLERLPVVRATLEFHDAETSWVASLVEDLGAPALLELRPERPGRPSVAVEFAALDAGGRPVGTAKVELDDRTAAAEPDDRTGGEGTPSAVVRGSPVNERAVDALVATGAPAAGQSAPSRLPTWLAPTQVRFVPVDGRHAAYCDALAEGLEAARIRVDVDDRDRTVGERLASAETDRVPYYAVVGDREVERGGAEDGEETALAVSVRGENAERELTVEQLREAVLEDVGDLPNPPRYLPKRVGERPGFASR
ncbi:His/Gly/Thr/Pro-type tRNA ligase C-terminal domain-containing protein [Halorussus salilacus]|uniref:threonyl-tRNA synthetase editing domain-containing protein n=1 Tax=Halorussus salilacus TaxID=2953750 RepID=UPI0020A1F169|nr:threonyl-tRNA synthetase editing domain-containing protein [Halorussus salilacus]USZ67503.1 His/Gly/Thr/Pro-type tRNA ligase C-terminal domain-containing protein [Halorussus salilacus]